MDLHDAVSCRWRSASRSLEIAEVQKQQLALRTQLAMEQLEREFAEVSGRVRKIGRVSSVVGAGRWPAERHVALRAWRRVPSRSVAGRGRRAWWAKAMPPLWQYFSPLREAKAMRAQQ
jgi:hypothetical protein